MAPHAASAQLRFARGIPDRK